MLKKAIVPIAFALMLPLCMAAENSTIAAQPAQPPAPVEKKWFETIQLRGYSQVRYNRLLETNPQLKCEQCDKSWGENGGIFLRRGRLIFSGNVSDRVYIYIQPDFASAAGSNQHYFQMRDAYFDLALDNKKEYRLRIGQSKVPYGFENMQSSQNRLPLDRHDALNSAVANERDLGVFFYWAPAHVRERFAYLVSSGLKGSGDYGVFALGAYNGQTANKLEANDNKHIVGRLTYPFKLKNGQIIEPGIQGFTGFYTMYADQISTGIKNMPQDRTFLDKRAAGTFVLYPQPLGIQAEYTVGVGPQFDKETNSVAVAPLKGGYATVSWLQKVNGQVFIPFTRLHYYEGGKKHELDARSYVVNEVEVGIEWQPTKAFELVVMYTISDRTFEDFRLPDNHQMGRLLRIQAQFNY